MCALSRGALSASQAAFLILFYLSWFFFLFFFFGLMSVTATGNKMLVRVCAVASQRRLWYIVRPFASVSWLPRHRLHVYWLGVNKARALRLFRLCFLCEVRLPLMWWRCIVRQHKCVYYNVSFAPRPFCCCFFALRLKWRSRDALWWLLSSLFGINSRFKKKQTVPITYITTRHSGWPDVILTSNASTYLCIWI